jgi:hypothetical protein
MKRFFAKVYDGASFVGTWSDVASVVSFSSEMNSGLSPLTLRLARGENDFGENLDVKLGNYVRAYCADKDSEEGVLVYSGYISRYIPLVDGTTEYVEVTLLSFWEQLARMILESSGDTEVAYLSEDPSDILKDLLDKFTANGGVLDYGVSSVEVTGSTVSYTYNTNTYQEALKKVIELCPDDWFFRVGADDLIYLSEKSETAEHLFRMNDHILLYKPEKRTENMVNEIYFRGGGTLYKKYVASGSVSTYGHFAKKIVDERITVGATMDLIANRTLNALSEPEIRITLKILDNNNGGGKGYDIESIKVGDTCKILGVTEKGNNVWDELVWDTDSWDYDIANASATVLQIQKIEYHPDYVILEISNRQPDIAKRIEDINRNLVASQTADNPSTPST